MTSSNDHQNQKFANSENYKCHWIDYLQFGKNNSLNHFLSFIRFYHDTNMSCLIPQINMPTHPVLPAVTKILTQISRTPVGNHIHQFKTFAVACI